MSGTSIVVCGQKFNIGTPVVLWDEPGGLNAYDETAYTTQDRATGKKITISGKRYGARTLLTPTLPKLQGLITQFFLHHTGLYSAKETFFVLHKERKLSVSFILDDNGIIYQNLDIKEKAWHGGTNNAISIGIEICSRAVANKLPNAYDEYHQQQHKVLPRRKRIDFVQKMWIEGYEYNNPQYVALIKLGKALTQLFPKMKTPNSKYLVDFPRDKTGKIVESLISNPLGHTGFICHYNTSSSKIDPISFNHKRFLKGVVTGNDPGVEFIDFSDVKNRQLALKSLGYDISADGIWGPKSEAALQKFQKANGLSVGWGPKTDFALNAAAEAKSVDVNSLNCIVVNKAKVNE